MSRWLIGAGVIVLAANALALWRAQRNRSGEPESRVELSERELSFHDARSDNSGYWLTWRYTNVAAPEDLGLNCRSQKSEDRRDAYAAFEIDGPAFHAMPPQPNVGQQYTEQQPRMVVTTVAPAPEALRARYPDRARVMILPVRLTGSGSCFVRDPLVRDLHLTREMAWKIRGHARFHATIAVGRNYEPWVEDVRPE